MNYGIIIDLILKLGVFWLDWTKADAERKREFLRWVDSHNKKALSSAKLNDTWKDLRAEMERDSHV
jgi:hypothetical protein